MPQIFSARTDRRLRLLLPALLGVALVAGALFFYHVRSDAYWGVGAKAEQPIGFRHDLHAGRMAIACTVCHEGAATEANARMPPAETCLQCHDETWRGTQALQPLYASVELRQPLLWRSLYALPDHARFHHGAHTASGVGCATCHGDVTRMARTEKAEPMSMAWCLDCHRTEGERRQAALIAARPELEGRLANPQLTDCSVCHY